MERSSFEGPRAPAVWRTKSGLETPLDGRFAKENRRLFFAPPRWYDYLVLGCLGFGALAIFLGVTGAAVGGVDFTGFGVFVGGAVVLAGMWAAVSNERMACDITQRTYARLEGQGFGKRVVRGSLQELHSVVLYAQRYMLGLSVAGDEHIVYRLVLYWKGNAQPLLVVERHDASIPKGAPINYGAGWLGQRGVQYAQALGIPFVDHSHQHSPGPLGVI